jgi:hypothetical protein
MRWEKNKSQMETQREEGTVATGEYKVGNSNNLLLL